MSVLPIHVILLFLDRDIFPIFVKVIIPIRLVCVSKTLSGDLLAANRLDHQRASATIPVS